MPRCAAASPFSARRRLPPRRPRVRAVRHARDEGPEARLLRAVTDVPRAARRAVLRERSRLPREALRLDAVGEADRLHDRLRGLRERGRELRPPRHRDPEDRPAQLRVRDVHRERADELPDEPRAGPRRDHGPGGGAGAPLPGPLPRQGRPRRRAPRVDAPRHVDGRRPRARAGPVRRDGLPLDDEGRQPLLRPARARVRADEGGLPPRVELVPLRHALHELPGVPARAGVAHPVDVAQGRHLGVLLVAVQERLRRSAREGVAGLDLLRARVPEEKPRGDPQVPDHSLQGRLATGARFRVARVPRPGREDPLRRPERARDARLDRGDQHGRRLRAEDPRHQGAARLHGDVPRVRPRQQDALLHGRQHGVPRPDGARPGHEEAADAAEGRAHRRHRLRQDDTRALGDPRPERHLHARPRPPSLRGMEAGLFVAVRRGRLRPRRLARWAAPLGGGRRDQRQAVRARDEDGVAAEGRRDSRLAVRLRDRDPVELRLQRGREAPLRELVLLGRLEHLPLRARDRHGRGYEQHRHRIFPSAPARRRLAPRLPLHRRGLRPRADRGEAREGRRADQLPRQRGRREAPDPEGVDRRLAGVRADRVDDHEDGRSGGSASNRSIRSWAATRAPPRSA